MTISDKINIKSNVPRMVAKRGRKEFAAECFRRGISYHTIRRLEKGDTDISLQTAFKVADIFSNCDIDFLFERALP